MCGRGQARARHAADMTVNGASTRAKGLAALVCPHAYCRSVFDIDPFLLKKQGIDGLIVDVDNTLVEWDKHEVTGDLKEWFGTCVAAGISCCIVSNSTRVRKIAAFARQLGVGFICPAVKPMPSSFRAAMRRLGTGRSNTAVVGDQVFTDVLGGNALGVRTILVQPVSPREYAWTRLVRRLERAVLRYLEAQGLIVRAPPSR